MTRSAASHETASARATAAGRLDAPLLGTWLFVVTEAMLFAGLLSAFVVLRAGASGFGGPGEYLEPISGAIATAVLLASSGALVLALRRARADARAAVAPAAVAVLLGVVFLALTAREWAVLAHDGVAPRTSLYWSSFFVLTGVHAAHVAFGVGWIVFAAAAARSGRADPLRLVATYWHFVDLVWIVLFALLYGSRTS